METLKLVDVVVEHGEVHGAPDHTVPIFKDEEGNVIRGKAKPFTIGAYGPVDDFMCDVYPLDAEPFKQVF